MNVFVAAAGRFGPRWRAIDSAIRAMPARWDLAAAALYVLVSLYLYATNLQAHVPASDGHYSWIYARSLAYDGDLDFTNDYATCGDPFGIGWITPAHRPANFFYGGPAVFWTPLIWLLKHLVHGAAPAIAGGCVGLVPTLTLALSSFAGGVVVFATSAVLRRVVRPGFAALNALLVTFGGFLIYFTVLEPSYSHVYDAMCIALLVLVAVRLHEDEHPRKRLVVAAGMLLGLAILQRASNGIFFLLVAGAVLDASTKTTLRRAAKTLFAVGALALVSGVVPLLLAEHAIYGRYTLYAHGPNFLHLTHAHPLLLVFDQRGGIFAWAPLLWLAVPGLVPLVRRRDLRWLALPLLACGTFELYVSSAALDWQGARRLANLTPLAALCMALALDPVVRWWRARPLRVEMGVGLVAIAAVAWANGSVCIGFANQKIAWDQPLTTAERYGEGQKQAIAVTERGIGPLSALPAAWVFALRYRLRPIAFGRAIHPEWYQRDMRTLDYTSPGFSFTDPDAKQLVRGFSVDPDHGGTCIVDRHATAVFAAQWPFATRARLLYDASKPERLSIGSRSFFGARTAWATDVALRPGKGHKAFLRIPPAGFDSGVNELEFEHDGPPGNLCLSDIEFMDDAAYPAAPEALANPPVSLWHALPCGSTQEKLPSVALGSSEQSWMIEVHEAVGGSVAFDAGPPGEFLPGGVLAVSGYRPRVATLAPDAVLEIDQSKPGLGELFLRMGHVHASEAGVSATWSPPTAAGSGFAPSITANGGQLVEVHTTNVESGALAFRVATYSADSVSWGSPVAFGRGFAPAVAIARPASGAGAIIIEVQQDQAKAGALSMRSGSLTAAGTIAWGEPHEYARGAAPSVAVVDMTLVEVHQEQDAEGSLHMMYGAIARDGHVTWRWDTSYDHGLRPVVAIDPITARAVAVHAPSLDFGIPWSHDGDVLRARE